MILKDLILRIRKLCPVFENRVFGSAQLEEGLRQAENIAAPAAFVMVDGDFPGENMDPTVALQSTEERWTIVVVVQNTDKRGQSASDVLHEVRRQLLGALLGWENFKDEEEDGTGDVETDWGPIKYRGSLHIDMSAARLWHQYSFGHTIILSAGRDYECIPGLKMAFRGGPTQGENTDEPFYVADGTTTTTVEPPSRPPSRNPKNPPFPNPATPAGSIDMKYGEDDDV